MNKYKRNQEEIKRDKEFAIDLWKKGYNIMQIADELKKFHDEINAGYTICYRTLARDIKDTVIEAKKLRKATGVDEINTILERYEYLYNECVISHRFSPSGGHLNTAASILEKIAKLQGLTIDKSEMTIKYDIDIE